MNIDIVVPIYNESLFIEGFLKDLFKQGKALESIRRIVIVDDGSTDQTYDLIGEFKNKKIRVIRIPKNRGKGYAMKVGLEAVKKTKADAVIFMDGDKQHNPKHLSKFIQSLRHHKIVFGYRKLIRTAPYFRKLGNKIAKYLFRTFFNIRRRDILCGYMAIRKDVYDDIIWESNDYGVEVEISAIVGKKRISFQEISVDTLYLDVKKGVTLTKAFFISLKLPYWYLKYQ